jgi:hypothetical protein
MYMHSVCGNRIRERVIEAVIRQAITPWRARLQYSPLLSAIGTLAYAPADGTYNVVKTLAALEPLHP